MPASGGCGHTIRRGSGNELVGFQFRLLEHPDGAVEPERHDHVEQEDDACEGAHRRCDGPLGVQALDGGVLLVKDAHSGE